MSVSAIPSIRAKAARQEQLARSFVSRNAAAPSHPAQSPLRPGPRRAGGPFRNIAILAAVFVAAAAQHIAYPFRVVSKEDHSMRQQVRSEQPIPASAIANAQHADKAAEITGAWLSPDGYIRLDLLPDGRYEEAWGKRRHAYTGRYSVLNASLLHFSDDSGFDVHGIIADGVLRIENYEFRRGE